MGTSKKMVVMVVVVLAITMSSRAQEAADGSCWESVAPCLESAKAEKYADAAVQPCCKGITDAIADNRPCFCAGMDDVLSQSNGERIFNGILDTCRATGTVRSLCPAGAATSPATAPSGTPSTPSGDDDATPSTPDDDADSSSPTGTPSAPSGSSTNGATLKMATKSISGVLMIFVPFMIL